MTTVRFGYKDGRYSISVTGHAGYNAEGPDIVCASCSMLSWLLVQNIAAEESDGHVRDLRYEYKGGDVCAAFVADANYAERIALIVDVIKGGFFALSISYPDNVMFVEGQGEL
ncbi:MAG TPA: hypothetical protein DEB31_05460 [Clostridiales bacterium]|nr:hypothetical protein [Clostridiales bacterium]